MNTEEIVSAPPDKVPYGERWARWQRWFEKPGRETGAVTAFFLLLTLLVFGRSLVGADDLMIGDGATDLERQFIHWRPFGFQQLAAGHLPLWNPHIYGGTQYFGGFQAALLYPPNWLYLFLPLARAVNNGIALHVFLAGWFMYFWVRHRGLHVVSAVLAGVLFMFGGSYFPHIFAGHLPNLCTMVWGPLILLSIDGWFSRRTLPWLLLGGGALTMQILAGHPQYVFYTGVACALYSVTKLWGDPQRWRMAAALALIPFAGVALSAVQLFEGLHAGGESLRSKGINIGFAGSFSFPPENLLTFLVPGFFGDIVTKPYWGRQLLWEACPFIGISGFVLALYALFRVRGREVWVCAGIALALFVVALGRYTPLFEPLYYYAPGFNKFRGWSKFIYPAMLFVTMLSAIGLDAMLRHGVSVEGPERDPARRRAFLGECGRLGTMVGPRRGRHQPPAVGGLVELHPLFGRIPQHRHGISATPVHPSGSQICRYGVVDGGGELSDARHRFFCRSPLAAGAILRCRSSRWLRC